MLAVMSISYVSSATLEAYSHLETYHVLPLYVSCWTSGDTKYRICNDFVSLSTFHWVVLDTTLLPDAEPAEDEVQDVVFGCRSGQRVESLQRFVEVEQ